MAYRRHADYKKQPALKTILLNNYMNTDNIQAQFNAVSEQYDRQRQALIPCFHDFYGTAVRLARQAGNVRHILDLPPQSVDLAVSGLAIHHLDDEGKQQLFRRVFQWLKPNGWLINADQVLGENAAAEALYTAAWREHVLADTFLDDAAKAAAFERIKLDKMATWRAQEAWLKQAGFPQPAVYYQYYNFIVFAAQKP